METTKYYTPTIDEFHVGFEYEYLKETVKGVDNWVSGFTVSINDDFRQLDKFIHLFLVRVKCLDREDIESLGWEYDRSDFFVKDKYSLILSNSLTERIKISVYNSDYIKDIPLFNGHIKNKSELKRLMKQIGI